MDCWNVLSLELFEIQWFMISFLSWNGGVLDVTPNCSIHPYHTIENGPLIVDFPIKNGDFP
jgi:hypothetical protein